MFDLELHPAAASTEPVTMPVPESDEIPCEDFLMRLAGRGKWGTRVADPAAGDGYAAKLFNTHYEWCLQWRFDPGLLQPGAKYRLEARARVEKRTEKGETFWAGVYDSGRRHVCGMIAPSVNGATDAYQWYTITTWIPAAGQYAWVGPGRFDPKKGDRSAIRAVYVDRMRLRRVD